MNIKYEHPLKGEVTVPGDKSISHRAVMFGALSKLQQKLQTSCKAQIVCPPSTASVALELKLKMQQKKS